MFPSQQPAVPITVAFTFLDLSEGGAQRLALDTCSHLDPARFRPVLVCARGQGALLSEARARGIPIHRLGRLRHGWDPLAPLALARCYRRLGAGIVQVPLYSRVAPYARLAAFLAGTPLCVGHEHSRPAPPPRLRRRIDRALLGLPRQRFLAVSAADAVWLRGEGVPAEAIGLLPNGIPLERFEGLDRRVARRALGLPPEGPVLLVPARLHPQKRHVDLIAAMVLLAPRRPDLRMLCAGDGPLRPRLEALAASAGLDGQLRFLGHREDMPRLMAAADLVVLASEVEGSPLALLEAQAAGRAVVASRVGGVPEIVEDGRTGRLVPPGQPAQLAEAMAGLLDDPSLRQAMGRRAAERARKTHGIDRYSRALERQYSAWLGELSDGATRHEPARQVQGCRR